MITNYLRYLRILHTLQNNVWLKTSELEAIQEKKLRAILNHAYRNVPYYHRLFDSVGVKPDDIKTIEDLSKIPIITKSQLKNANKEIIARNVDLNNCVEQATSGSTGDPLTLLFSKEDVLYAGASYDLVRIENGFKLFRDVLLSTTGESVTSNKKWYKHLGILRRESLNVFDSLDTQIQLLKKIKPDAMWGYPSAIKLLAKEVQEKAIKSISPRLIFTASEVFDQETRDFINSVFNVDLFDVYGSWEAGACMAWECGEHAGYHMSMDSVLMEFLDENGERVSVGERGKVVVTNLHSYAMPIIRYEIGDFAIPTDEECSCGRGGYLMKAIEGRSKDVLVTSNGKIIVSSFVPYLFYPDCIYSEATIKQYQKIKQFQVIQKSKNEIIVKIIKEPESDEEEFNYILTNFKNVFGESIDIKLIFVESIPPLPSGKSTYVISNINRIMENTNVE